MLEEGTHFFTQGGVIEDSAGDFHVFWGPFRFSDQPPDNQWALCAPHFLSWNQAFLTPARYTKMSALDFETWLAKLDKDLEKPSLSRLAWDRWSQPSFESFAQIFGEIQRERVAGGLQKAVPVTKAVLKASCLSPTERWVVLQNLLENKGSNQALYGLWYGGYFLLGATPEVLVQVEGRKLFTVALAGTRKPNSPSEVTQEKEFLSDPKESIENQLVVEDIVEKLGIWGTPQVGRLEVLRLPHLEHLLRRIEVTASCDVEVFSVLKTLHPTGALGVLPRSAGKTWLFRLGPSRLRMGAPIAWGRWPHGPCSAWVAIRNIEWFLGEFSLASGCGIVEGSVLEKEFLELHNKKMSVICSLGLPLSAIKSSSIEKEFF